MNYKIILTGPSCCGKTTTLNALKEKLGGDPRYRFIDEIATQYILEQKQKGFDPFADLIAFERKMITLQAQAEDAVSQDGTLTIMDRSMLDSLAITKLRKIGKAEHINLKPEFLDVIKKRQYHLVFILAPRPFIKAAYRKDQDGSEMELENKYLKKVYEKYAKVFGYQIIYVPFIPVAERTEFVIREIKKWVARAEGTMSTSKVGLFSQPQTNDIVPQELSQPTQQAHLPYAGGV